jgi:ABC-type oligopeptide transport system substrate-binding subunit
MNGVSRVIKTLAALALGAALVCAACGTKPKAASALDKAKERNNRAQSEMQGAFLP